MEILDMQSKYAPFHVLFTKTFRTLSTWSMVRRSKVLIKNLWKEYKGTSQSKLQDLQTRFGADAVSRAYLLLAVLRQTTVAVHGKDFTCWVTNCGRNVSHHSGFVPMLLRFKMLREAPRSTAVSLDLGSTTGRLYQLRSDNLVEALRNLCQLIRLADAVKKGCPSVQGPQSCSTWSKSFQKLSGIVQDSPCPGMRNVNSYLPLWTMWCMLLRHMYTAGAT